MIQIVEYILSIYCHVHIVDNSTEDEVNQF
jgi:hypothetical protein